MAGNDTAPQPPEERIHNALAEIWMRSRSLVLARVATIELAAEELNSASASSERLEAGSREAHKLAGLLGTFGLERGTKLARDLEEHLTGPNARRESSRLRRLAGDLRATVQEH